MIKNKVARFLKVDKELPQKIEKLKSIDCHINDHELADILSRGDMIVQPLEDTLIEATNNNFESVAAKRDTQWFQILHALCLLGHLKSEKSLEVVLRFLAQDEKYLKDWVYDLLDEDLWEFIFQLGQNRLDELEYFLLHPGNNSNTKLAVITALVQIGLHFPDKKLRVNTILVRVLQEVNEDPDFIGLTVAELMDYQEPMLKPIILKALDENNVLPEIISAEEVNHLYRLNKKRKIRPATIYDRYAFYRQLPYFSRKQQTASQQQVIDVGKVEESA